MFIGASVTKKSDIKHNYVFAIIAEKIDIEQIFSFIGTMLQCPV